MMAVQLCLECSIWGADEYVECSLGMSGMDSKHQRTEEMVSTTGLTSTSALSMGKSGSGGALRTFSIGIVWVSCRCPPGLKLNWSQTVSTADFSRSWFGERTDSWVVDLASPQGNRIGWGGDREARGVQYQQLMAYKTYDASIILEKKMNSAKFM